MDRCPPKLTGYLSSRVRTPCKSAFVFTSSRFAIVVDTTGPHRIDGRRVSLATASPDCNQRTDTTVNGRKLCGALMNSVGVFPTTPLLKTSFNVFWSLEINYAAYSH